MKKLISILMLLAGFTSAAATVSQQPTATYVSGDTVLGTHYVAGTPTTSQFNIDSLLTLGTVTATNYIYAGPVTNGIVTSNSFSFLLNQQYASGMTQFPQLVSTWGQYGAGFNSNNFLAYNGSMAFYGVNFMSQPSGYAIVADDGMFSTRVNGVLTLDATKFPWTPAQMAAIAHTNGLQLWIYREPNDVIRAGLTSAGYPDSEGTNIEWDAMNDAIAGFDGAKLDCHGSTSPQEYISLTQRYIYTFRSFATNRPCQFMIDANWPTTWNNNLLANAFPGCVLRLNSELVGFDTNTLWMVFMTNRFDWTTGLQHLQTPQQRFTYEEWYNNYPFGVGLMLAAAIEGSPPIWYGLNGITPQQANLMTNTELRAVYNDSGFVVGKPMPNVGSTNTFLCYPKALADQPGCTAVLLLNRTTNTTMNCGFTWTNAGYQPGRQMIVRDLVNLTNSAVTQFGYTNSVPGMSAMLVILIPVDTFAYSQFVQNGTANPLNFAGPVSSELGRVQVQAGLLLDAAADATNSGTVISRSPLAQAGQYTSFASWTNSAYGPGIFAQNLTSGNGLDFGANPAWMPSNSVTFDLVFSATNSSVSFSYMTNSAMFTGINLGANGYAYFYVNGNNTCQANMNGALVVGGRHEVTGTYDVATSNALLYVDGNSVAAYQFPTTTTITNVATNHIMFAANNCTALRLRMYGRALAQSEVSDLYRTISAPLTFTNGESGLLTSGGFKSLPGAGFVTASVVVTNSQIVWLTNATAHYCVPMGNLSGLWTNYDAATIMCNSNDSVCVTNISGTGGATLQNSWFQAYH